MRVYEFAKKHGVASKQVITFLQQKKIKVASHMAVLTDAMQQHLKSFGRAESTEAKLQQPKKVGQKPAAVKAKQQVAEPDKQSVQSVAKTGVIEKSEGEAAMEKEKVKASKPASKPKPNHGSSYAKNASNHSGFNRGVSSAPAPNAGPVVVDLSESYTVGSLAKKLAVSQNQLTMFFLKKGHFYSINSAVPASDIQAYANELGIEAVMPAQAKTTTKKTLLATDNSGEPRAPIVVIMGHVDHGKTTLIDYIRKTKVADKEKGGITQNVRVYNAQTSAGDVVVVDTPGHEAFTTMRGRGAQVTDVVVLIVAADDGVMPQTIESIKMAQEMEATLIVAINKIDKPGVEVNFDKIYQQLSQHDILVEAWGGDVVCVPISAKTGRGVDELLEMIHLQSEMLDLRAKTSGPAKAFVLESQVEKGLGTTAVVIVKEGELSKGDSFVVGSHAGKVKALFGSDGKPLPKLKTSQAGKVVGLSHAVGAGELLQAVSATEALAHKPVQPAVSIAPKHKVLSSNQDQSTVKVLAKADTFGTLEAVVKALELLGKKDKQIGASIKIVSSGVGDVFEKDVQLAVDSNAMIVGMNVKVESAAQTLAKTSHIKIVKSPIIYRLVEAVEETVVEHLKSVKKLQEVGRAKVTKVFDLKAKGVVAGCVVHEGYFDKVSQVACWRDGQFVGQGKVISLQSERSAAEKVNAGGECGVVCQGFRDWQIGDEAVCSIEVSLYQK